MESFFILKNISKPKKIIAEKNGFNKYPFFLGPFWGLFKGLWLEGFIWLILINFAIYLAPDLSLLFILTSSFFWGFFGKDIYIQKLINSKYVAEDLILADSPRTAILIFLTKNK